MAAGDAVDHLRAAGSVGEVKDVEEGGTDGAGNADDKGDAFVRGRGSNVVGFELLPGGADGAGPLPAHADNLLDRFRCSRCRRSNDWNFWPFVVFI